MKKTGAIAVAVALAVGLTAAPAQAQTTKKDRQYLALVKSYSTLANYGSNKQLIRMGKQVCRVFDSGATLYELVAGIMPSLDSKDAEDLFAATTAAAVVVYCPRHQNELE